MSGADRKSPTETAGDDGGPAPGEDRLARAQRLAAARGIVTGPAPRTDSEELLAMLSDPPPDPPSASLDEVSARPGEVPSLHSDRSLYFLWVALAAVVLLIAALGTWAVFFRKPF